MHISEGVLSAPVLAAGAVLTAGGIAVGLKKIEYDELPQVAVFSATFFVASLIHVPIGLSSAHLILNGVCGLILGWAAFPAIFVGLVLQALLFQFGGLTTLGVNTFNMAFPAVLLGFLCRGAVRGEKPVVRGVASFVCGGGAVLLSGILVALCLVSTGDAFVAAAGVILVAHLPVMAAEGLLTIFIVEFLRKTRPEIMESLRG
jgi:cobalt/nickel transport system permease protein